MGWTIVNKKLIEWQQDFLTAAKVKEELRGCVPSESLLKARTGCDCEVTDAENGVLVNPFTEEVFAIGETKAYGLTESSSLVSGTLQPDSSSPLWQVGGRIVKLDTVWRSVEPALEVLRRMHGPHS